MRPALFAFLLLFSATLAAQSDPGSTVPVVSSPTLASATVGLPFSYQISASNGPTSFSATGLPAGLTLDSVSGLISGTPTTTGLSTVSLTAANAVGSSATLLLSLRVSPVPDSSQDRLLTFDTSEDGWRGHPREWPTVSFGADRGRPGGALQVNVPANVFYDSFAIHRDWSAEWSGTPGTYAAFEVDLRFPAGQTPASVRLAILDPLGFRSEVFFFGETYEYSPLAPMMGVARQYGWITPLSDGWYRVMLENTGKFSGLPADWADLPSSVSMHINTAGGLSEGQYFLLDNLRAYAGIRPIVTSTRLVSLNLGQALNLPLTASGNPDAFSAQGLPAGLSLNATTGVVSGTPAAVGASLVTVTAARAGVAGPPAYILMNVVPLPLAPPVITSVGGSDRVVNPQTPDVVVEGTGTPGAQVRLFSGGLALAAGQNHVRPEDLLPRSLRGGSTNPSNANGRFATAVLNADGSVTVSGDAAYGGDPGSPEVAAFIASGVMELHVVAEGSFVALKADGELMSWGALRTRLSRVARVVTSMSGFAVLTLEGTLAGFGSYQGATSASPAGFGSAVPGGPGWQRIFAGGYGSYAAQRYDGSFAIWGYSAEPNASNQAAVARLTGTGIAEVTFNYGAGAALRSDGEVVMWGHPGYFTFTGADFPSLLTAGIVVGADGRWTYSLTPSDLARIGIGAGRVLRAEATTGSGVSARVAGEPFRNHGLTLRASAALTGNGTFGDSAQVLIDSSYANRSIYYSIDGTEPYPGGPLTYNGGGFVLNATATVRALAVNLDDFSMIRADPLLVTIVPTHVLTVTNALGGDAGPGRGGRILRNNTGTPFERMEERLLTGTSVDLTAVADPGWTFLRWAGDASGTAAQTSVMMDRSRSVQAVFGTTLATSAVGPGAIQISPSPGPYAYGQVVRLYPKPAVGAAFSLWGGAGSGSATPLDFTVTAPGATVSALFTSLGAGQVNLSWEAVGNGVVTVSPQKSFYAANETVTVTAVPGPNQVFTGWSGALSGMENPAAVTLSTSKAVTANFQQGVVVSVTSPSRNVVPAGGSLTLSATVTGTPAPTLQWFRNGLPIAGATNASLVIRDASALYDAGWYQLRASNQFGIVAGETRFVIVGPGEAAQIKAWGAGSGGDFPQGGHADLISVSSGTDHGIALKRDGTVVAWGNNGFGKATVPIGLRDVVGVAAAGWHNLALKGDGTVAAWGHNYAGETSVPEGLSQVVAIAAGWIFSVALKQDGSIVVWGEGSYRQKAVPADLVNVVAIAAGSYHGLALKQDGTVTGWGWNSYGEVNVPADLRNVVAIAAGASHSLALRSDGSVVGWGRNDDGQSTPPSGLTDVVAVAAGAAHSVALKRDGTVVAWGQTTNGQGAVPAGMARVVALAAGGNQTLALRDTATDSTPLIVSQPTPNVAAAKGQYAVLAVQASAGAASMAFQWRRNGVTLPNATNAEYRVEVDEGTVGTYTVQVSNYLGSVTSEPAIVALRQSPLISLTQGGRVVVSRGSSTAIEIDPALLTPGSTVQWTRNGRPLVGATGTSLAIANASQLNDSGWYRAIVQSSSGIVRTRVLWVVVGGASQVVGWGLNGDGQVTTPAGLNSAVSIGTGFRHTLAIKEDGSVLGWGENIQGQATPPAGLKGVVAVAGGWRHSLALKSDGTIVGWGRSSEGQITVPAGLGEVVAIACGSDHSVAVRSDGSVLAWGSSAQGQLLVPPSLTGVVDVSAAWYHTLALKGDGTVVGFGTGEGLPVPAGLSGVRSIGAAWGHNVVATASGQVLAWGNNGNARATVPAGIANALSVVTRDWHNLALLADGRVIGWGYSPNGEISVPPGLGRVVMISAGQNHSVALRDASADSLPVIVSQPPVAISAAVGQTVGLKVTASGGDTPISYQWRRNGVEITGATQSAYSVFVGPDGPMTFDVVVSNYLGAITSSSTTLTVAATPRLDENKGGRLSVLEGGSFTLEVDPGMAATGASIQWLRGGLPLAGATNGSLLVANATRHRDDDWYQVTTSAGGVARNSAPLFVRVPVEKPVLVAWGGGPVSAFGSGITQGIIPFARQVTGVASGRDFSLIIDQSGALQPWGVLTSAGAVVPSGLANVVELAIGESHVLALLADGSVVAWGSNSEGQTSVPQFADRVVRVAASGNASFALMANGKVSSWGSNSGGRNNVPEDLANVVRIATAGGEFGHPRVNIALKANGEIVHWGGPGASFGAAPIGNVADVKARTWFGFAITADGSLLPWGEPYAGVLGAPVGLSGVKFLSVGYAHSVAILPDDSLSIWGDQGGAAGNWSYIPASSMRPVGFSNFEMVAAGGGFTLGVHDGAGGSAPTIVTSPASQTVDEGTPVTFAVTVNAGSAPVTYQWRKGGVAISGATSATLTLPEALAADAGSYDVVVTNYLGTVTSSAATLTITPSTPPVITQQPQPATALAGQPASFSVTATGSPPRFQWLRNDVPLSGATQATLSLPAVTLADAGFYTVRLTNRAGTATSAAAALVVNAPPVITVQPAGQTALAGSPVTLSVTVTGHPTPAYQWSLQGNAIPGATAASFTRSSVQPADAGTYRVTATNAFGTATSEPVGLTVNAPPTITTQPAAQAAIPGGSATFSVVAAGSPTPSLQWYKGADPIPGASGASLTLNPVATGDEGQYQVVVTNPYGTVTSSTVSLTVNLPPVITTQPAAAKTVALGTSADFIVVATGTPAPVYQWRKEGVSIPGATGSVFTIGSAGTLDAGTYTVLVSNAGGSVVSTSAVLTVLAAPGTATPPVITAQPLPQTLAVGASLSLSVTATGTPPLTYTWRKDGVVLPGATSATYAVPSVQMADAGTYQVDVANSGGTASSSGAAVVVVAPPLITQGPLPQTVNPGGRVTLTVQATAAVPLAYQWRRNTVALPGATAASLRFLARDTDAGSYDVVVTAGSPAASSTSAAAGVTVRPSLFLGPDATGAQEVAAGSSVTLSALDQTTPAERLRWKVNGRLIPQVSGRTLQLANVQAADTGWYQLQTADALGQVTLSAAVFVQVRVPSQAVAWGANGLGQALVPAALTDPLQLSAGPSHTLAIQTGGAVVGFGAQSAGQLPVPAGLAGAVRVAAGHSHSVALLSDGTLETWGGASAAQTTVPSGLTGVVAVAAGRVHTLALRSDGTVVGWGMPSYGQEAVPSGLSSVVAIAAGADHSLALRADGTVLAWGRSDNGRTTLPASLTNIVAIAAGSEHSLALRADGRVIAWGKADPVLTGVPANLTDVVAIAAGQAHSVALKRDGTVVAWGYDTEGQLVVPSQLGGIHQLSAAGSLHTAVLRDRRSDAAPVILASPESRLVPVGAPLTLAVAGQFGTAPLSVVWTRDDVPLSGATATTYLLAETPATAAGVYRARVSNYLGTATSAAATITVDAPAGGSPARILAGPVAATILSGQPATLSVQAAGSPPLTYQWRRDNVVIPGATGSVLRLENVTTPGTYAVDVTAQIGAPATASAAVGVITAQAGLSSAQPGYVPGGLVTLQASLSYSGTPTGLGYSLVLPPGWSLVSSTGEAEVKPVAGATDTLGWAWTSLPASPLSFSVTVQPPVGGTGSATLTGTGIVRTGTAGYELSLPVVTLPQLLVPVITTQPISQVAGVGAGVVFSVVATGSGPLSYVWTRNGQILANGGQVAGAETATLTLANVGPAEAGSYQCRVANAAGEVLSTAATLTLASLTPEHALGATGYQPGASISVRSTLTHTNPAGSLTWSVLLPAGWNLRSSSGDAGALRPAVAATDLLEWTWATLPPSPFTFEYVLNTPAGSSGDRQVSALVTLRQAGTSTQVTAKPDPLQVVEVVAHSADVDRNLRISLVELTRVIELYNTRSGPTRTGCYGNQAGTEDGFAAVPARGALERAVLGVYHSADANRDGKLNLLELTRVIELYNTREAGTRTGRYSLRPGTEDGFTPGG